jgi:hypothetical protein
MSEAANARIAEDEARWRAWLEIARWESGECLEEGLGRFPKRPFLARTIEQESDRPAPALSPIVARGGER